mmetsp:Transcript_7629/g.14292  ORF Transcript_7629/g.14292 Transcript_7629/m.14292 type:complete len:214 (-) Transcript_7629:112-753(-)
MPTSPSWTPWWKRCCWPAGWRPAARWATAKASTCWPWAPRRPHGPGWPSSPRPTRPASSDRTACCAVRCATCWTTRAATVAPRCNWRCARWRAAMNSSSPTAAPACRRTCANASSSPSSGCPAMPRWPAASASGSAWSSRSPSATAAACAACRARAAAAASCSSCRPQPADSRFSSKTRQSRPHSRPAAVRRPAVAACQKPTAPAPCGPKASR